MKFTLLFLVLVLVGCGRQAPKPTSEEAWRQHQEEMARDRAYSQQQAEAWRKTIVIPEPLQEFQK